MLWPYSGSTCITMERSIKTTLRLRALARGPVWICQSFLQGSTLGESEEKGERERQMEGEKGEHGQEGSGKEHLGFCFFS